MRSLENLDELRSDVAKRKHLRAFVEVTKNETISLNESFFVIKSSRFWNYIKTSEIKIKDYIDSLIHNVNPSKKQSENYLLGMSFIQHEGELGLLTTLVDGAGDHLLNDGDPGKDKYLFIKAKPIAFSGDKIEIDQLEGTIHQSEDSSLKDNWLYPEAYYVGPSANSLEDWLNGHDVNSCLKEYIEYYNQGEAKLEDVNKAVVYAALWELEGLKETINSSSTSNNEEYDSIGIFPIVMKSDYKSGEFSPQTGHFMSFLFMPIKGKEENGNFIIESVKTDKPFLISGKGYPKSWKQNLRLHTKHENSLNTVDFNKFK